MVKQRRVTLRKRNPFSTVSNRTRIVKTPGGRLLVQYLKKKGSGVSCGDCGCQIHGIPHKRPHELARLSKRRKTVSRAYGGRSCAKCVQNRILRAFLIEEQKVYNAGQKLKAKSAPKKNKAAKTDKKKKDEKAVKAEKAAVKEVVKAKDVAPPKKGTAAAKKAAPQKKRV